MPRRVFVAQRKAVRGSEWTECDRGGERKDNFFDFIFVVLFFFAFANELWSWCRRSMVRRQWGKISYQNVNINVMASEWLHFTHSKSKWKYSPKIARHRHQNETGRDGDGPEWPKIQGNETEFFGIGHFFHSLFCFVRIRLVDARSMVCRFCFYWMTCNINMVLYKWHLNILMGSVNR